MENLLLIPLGWWSTTPLSTLLLGLGLFFLGIGADDLRQRLPCSIGFGKW